MKLLQYGLVLESLRPASLEQLRQWRNDPAITRYMEYREPITPAMQRAWFERIQTLANYYLMIRVEEQLVGLIHLSEVDETGAQAGLFLGDPAVVHTSVPVRASLAILDFAFRQLRLREVTAKVHRDNMTALQYNARLGFEPWQAAGHPDFSWLQLRPDRHYEQTRSLRSFLEGAYGGGLQELDFEADQPLDEAIAEELERRGNAS